MLDHVGFAVSDYARSKGFYERALAPLGLTVLLEPVGEAAGFGRDGKPFFWIEARGWAVVGRIHVAFAVDDRETVDAFHSAALEAGGTDNGRRGYARSITPITTVYTSSTRTVTTSRRSTGVGAAAGDAAAGARLAAARRVVTSRGAFGRAVVGRWNPRVRSVGDAVRERDGGATRDRLARATAGRRGGEVEGVGWLSLQVALRG